MQSLIFRDGIEALAYVCQRIENPVGEGTSLPAVVLEAADMLGSDQAVKINPDGNQIALLRVASLDGGFAVMATTLGPNGPRLQPGQLVLWKALSLSPALAQTAFDDRFGWLGVITGTLRPEWRDNSWVEDEQFQM
jgi:hypothetical protein